MLFINNFILMEVCYDQKKKFLKSFSIVLVFMFLFTFNTSYALNINTPNPTTSFVNSVPTNVGVDAKFVPINRSSQGVEGDYYLRANKLGQITLYIHSPRNSGASWTQGTVYIRSKDGKVLNQTMVGNYSGDIEKVVWKGLEPYKQYDFRYEIYKMGRSYNTVTCYYQKNFF